MSEPLLTDEQAQRMLRLLSAHYGERIAPVSQTCEAIRDWVAACLVAADEYKQPPEGKRGSPPPLYRVRDMIGIIELEISKSDYLRRRIYAGEPHRTVKCPVHKGRWSGIIPPDERYCPCMDPSGNMSGWIHPDNVEEEQAA